MNSSPLNQAFDFVLAASWQACLFALIVLLADCLLRRRLSPQARHALWMLVAVRLLLPALPDSPISVTCAARKLWRTIAEPVTARTAVAEGPQDARTYSDPFQFSQAKSDSAPSEEPGGSPIDLESVVEHDASHGWRRAERLYDASPPPWLVVAWNLAAMVWLAGVAACLATSARSWHRFHRRLDDAPGSSDPSLVELLEECCRQLGRRRGVSLVISRQVATPAVTGLWRPRILLPPRVAAELTKEQLRFVLLHELTHLKRGDVLLGWLTALLAAVHWFNPLLRQVFSRMRQLRELACDQAVLERVGYQHGNQYGHTIVRVLELIDPASTRIAPAGVAGMAYWTGKETGSLQERIRMLTPMLSSRRRSTILAISSAVLLAAVGLTDGGEDADRDADSAPAAARPWPVVAPAPVAGVTVENATALGPSNQEEAERLFTVVYSIEGLLPIFRTAHQCDEQEAEQRMIDWLQHAAQHQPGSDDLLGVKWLDASRVVVRQSPEVHERFEQAIERVRRFGLEQVRIEVRIVTAPEKVVQALPADWTLQPIQSQRLTGSNGTPGRLLAGGALPVEAYTVKRKELPVMLEVLDEERARRLLDHFQDHRRVNILAAPRISVLNGIAGSIFVGTERPFVVGLKRGEPQLRIVQEGTSMHLCPLVMNADAVWLNCQLELPRITAVETATVRSASGKPVTLQTPEVETTRLGASLRLPLGKTLLLGGVKTHRTDNGWQSLVVLIRADKFDDMPADPPTAAEPTAASPAASGDAASDVLPAPRALPRKKAPTSVQSAGTGRLMFGTGVNSDAGLTGRAVLEEPSATKDAASSRSSAAH